MSAHDGSETLRSATDALAALLVREGILPASRIEEAQERVILNGGTLDTALLELGLLEEKRILELLPRAYNARAVGKLELDGVDASVAGVFPRRLAEKHGVVPIEVSGRRLTLAVSGPPDLALLDEIGFMLSVYVKPAVTTQARIASALARLYGVPVPPRLEALLPRVGESPLAVRAAVEAWQARTAHTRRTPSLKLDPVPPAPRQSEQDESGWQIARSDVLLPGAPSAPNLTLEDGGSLDARAVAERRAAAGGSLDEAEEKRRRTRVLWTVDDAIAELALADDRDALIDVVLRFAYRRLGTVAAFIYARGRDGAKDAFVGWDVIDPLLARRDIAGFSLAADGGHALGQVLEMRSPFLGPLRKEDPLVRLFGRRSRAVVLLPILLGDRFAGVLYGDCGSKSIPPSSLAELHMVVPRLGKGLGNLILRNKKALRSLAVVAPSRRGAAASSIVGALVDEPLQLTDLDLIEVDIEEDLEEDIAVSTPAPARSVPVIDLDIDIDLALEGTTDPAASASPRPAGTAPATTEPTPMPWADGMGDDEDVRLDDAAFADLDSSAASRRHGLVAAPLAPRIELGLDEELLASEEGAPVDIDAAPEETSADAREVEALLGQGLVVPDVQDDVVVPGFRPPEPEASTGLIARRVVAAAAAERRTAEGGRDAAERDDTPGLASSPGARAREALLLATHNAWLLHEDAVLDDLVGQLHRPGESQRRAALAAVTSHGARAMPSLARYFPGVLAVHPFGAMESRPEVVELSDCVACLVKLGADRAAPILVAELADEDRLHRWTAVWSLSAIHVPGALPRLAQRVFDAEPAIAALALEVLDAYRADPAFEKVLSRVRDLVRRGDAFERQRAILAVAELKDRGALPALVDLLGTRPKETSEEARRALVEISKQDFGSAERRWRAWIADNDKTPRTRWLIDGLASKDDEIRRSAQQELNRLTGQFFAYRWDAPRADREQSLAAWEEWWGIQRSAGRWP